MAEEKDLKDAAENTEVDNIELEITDATEEAEQEECKVSEDKKDKKKKEKADKKYEELKEKIKELEDVKLRQMAEFQNFRTRSEKEKSQMFDRGAKNVIEKILPVVDNFERGLAAVPEEEKDSAFVNGMTLVYKQLMDEFDKMGVKAIEAVGQEFNPDLHNAVMQVEAEDKESGTVVAELQKGYTYHDSVVRHSMVSVAQ